MPHDALTAYFKALSGVTASKHEFDRVLQSHRNRLTDEEIQEAHEIYHDMK